MAVDQRYRGVPQFDAIIQELDAAGWAIENGRQARIASRPDVQNGIWHRAGKKPGKTVAVMVTAAPSTAGFGLANTRVLVADALIVTESAAKGSLGR